MEDLLNAVTLVVKTPNQKIADQTVQCGMEWTIRKLKSHLSSVYPSNPHEKEQKIIYSGKLLQDDTVLKDILKQYDDDQTTHIVHLVCADSITSTTSSQPKPSGATSARNATASAPIHPPDIASEGVRQRNVTSTHSQAPHTPAAGGPMVYNAMYPGMMPYSPDQIFWMQQMYTQQMMAYMQYMQQGSYPPQLPPGAVTPNAPLPEPAQPNAANQPANQQAAADQPVRMNAQGGADDDDMGNNDWLDWVYTLCRFSVLLSIIYFYSTIGRFVMVFGFFILMYLFQSGWFRLRRRNANGPGQQQQQQQQQPQPQQQPQQQQQVPGNPDQPDPARPEGDAAADATTAPTTPTETTEPQRPGVLRIMVSFITMLFVSLVPQRPPAVNAN